MNDALRSAQQHSAPAVHPPAERTAVIALAGQPNMGKSTLFNLLTGLNQHVGNWPGKTVEQRQGGFVHHQRTLRLVDLPGTYSLSANSPEEIIAREYILHEKPDLVVAVVSAAHLERSLYLVAELIALPAPLVVALNMMDVAAQQGIQIDVPVLEAALGVPVVPLVATRAEGVRRLLDVIEDCLTGSYLLPPRRLPAIRPDHQQVLDQAQQLITGFVPPDYPAAWTASKLLEGDGEILRQMQAHLPEERWESLHALLKAHDDAGLAIASGRYAWIERMLRAAVHRPIGGQMSLTDRLDRFATHPVLGLVILALILGAVFWLTFTIGAPLQEWLESALLMPLTETARGWLAAAPFWLRGLVIDGLIGGAGAVITFLPILVIFFSVFGLLEDVGYMARAAFVMDRLMHAMGLHGKSFLPLFLGFGCNVPAVMGTRVIESWPARLLTMLLAPLVPCAARMAVLAFLAAAFFGAQGALVSWGLVLFALLLLVVSGMALNRLLFKGERSAFIMELPLYHIPNLRTIALLVWQRSLAFIRKAATLILLFSLGVWALAVLPGGEMETSYLAQIGRFFAPLGRLAGLDWRLTVALLSSFLAKENAVATLGVLFGRGEDSGLAQTLATTYSPASGLAFMTIALLFIPCAATLAVLRQESGSWKWAAVNVLLMLVVSFAAGAGVYTLARALGG
ncbi:MAG: ferrous iron transport protein B [Anaerolineae bacterium]|nr:ferrous iron transport protein B [Anaerolineae bacterium]